MKYLRFSTILLSITFSVFTGLSAETYFRLNQEGYLPEGRKYGVFLSRTPVQNLNFSVCDALTLETVGSFKATLLKETINKFKYCYLLDFSNLKKEGTFTIRIRELNSPVVYINQHIYRGLSEKLLEFIRNQRTEDNKKGAWWINGYMNEVSPGITAAIVYQLLTAYRQNPAGFGDAFNAEGNKIPDNIPDILNEAKYGLDYLTTSLPEYFYADIKASNAVSMASLAGKYAAALAIGADVLGTYYPDLQSTLQKHAEYIYDKGLRYTGLWNYIIFSDPLIAEKNWEDDLQMAAVQLYLLTLNDKYLRDARYFNAGETVPGWLTGYKSTHWEWYPFVNYSYLYLADLENPAVRQLCQLNLKNMISGLKAKGKADNFFRVFQSGFINEIIAEINLYASYRIVNKDIAYLQSEELLFDALGGLNEKSINIFQFFDKQSINRIPDIPDYKEQLNIDAAAQLIFTITDKTRNTSQGYIKPMRNEMLNGGIIRTDRTIKNITLLFVGNQYNDGFEKITRTLEQHQITAGFFLSGDFIRKQANQSRIKELIRKGYYVGPATNKFNLLVNWNNPSKIKVTKTEFSDDLRENYAALNNSGVNKSDAPFLFAPYEMYNDSIAGWCREFGIYIVRSTPGTLCNKDYTFPEMRENYYSSSEIMDNITEIEQNQGLNGYILQFHLGSNVNRTDKFYNNLGNLIMMLKKKGYTFTDIFTASNIVQQTRKTNAGKK